MNPADIACIILASGLSQRFGEADKLEADLCGKTVLSHVIETAKQVGFGKIYVVSNRSLSGEYRVVKNENPKAGQGHALRLGLSSACKSDWEYCLILLGDMPLISSTYLKNMISKNTEKQSVISLCESTRMPPAMFNKDAIDKILSLEPSKGAREIFDKIDLQTVKLPPEQALDVDTPEDLTRVAKIMRARKI